jgi:hypothetical protein
MKFLAFYENNGDARTRALHVLYSVLKQGANLGKDPFNHQFVRTVPFWLNWSSFTDARLSQQIEKMEYKNQELHCAGLLVIEAESSVLQDKESAS